MDSLRSMFEELHFSNVKTYIQSGNVLFKSEMPSNKIIAMLEVKFTETFGFSSLVVLRTKEELEDILKNLPFTKEEIDQASLTCVGESLHITLLKEVPSEERLEKWMKYKTAIDEFKLVERDVYLLFRTTIRDSKLAIHIQKLGEEATTRNWNTMMKMVQLANEMEVE